MFSRCTRKTLNMKNYVPHPRYGVQPIVSGYLYSKAEIESAHWRYASLRYFAAEETQLAKTIGLALFELGYIKNINKVNRIR